jgi:hypothetical protein
VAPHVDDSLVSWLATEQIAASEPIVFEVAPNLKIPAA